MSTLGRELEAAAFGAPISGEESRSQPFQTPIAGKLLISMEFILAAGEVRPYLIAVIANFYGASQNFEVKLRARISA